MTPTASPGDHLLVTPLGRDALLKEGELIVTRMGGRLVAHRLVEKFPGGVVTRGDAARSDDPPIAISDVLGRVVAIHRKGNAPDGGPL